MAYNLTKLQEIIAHNLGLGRVEVELNAEHYRRAIDATLKMLARWYPQHGFQVIPVSAGGSKYELKARNCIGVIDCTFFNSGIRFEEAPYYTRWTDRTFELIDMKDTQRVFGDDPIWFEQEEIDAAGEPHRYVYAQFTQSSFVDTFARIPTVMCVEFTWEIEASDDPRVGVSRIPRDMHQWVEDYATARCRVIMGDVRGKFTGVPGADDGSLLPVDGAMQVQRAEEKMRALEKDLEGRRRQMPMRPV